MQITFDVAKEKDLSAVNCALNMPEVNRFFNFKAPLAFEETTKWYQEVINNREANTGECIVVRNDDGTLVGWSYVLFENYKITKELETILESYSGRKGYIGATVIIPKYQGKGMGKKLIGKVEELLLKNKITQVWYGTHSDNVTLRKMHEGLGYSVIGVISRYKIRVDGSVVDQFIMYKHL